jgi:hypothetical protein
MSSNPHTTAAERSLELSYSAPDGGSHHDVSRAAVEATLAVAYAQHTANLIAYQANVERSYQNTLTRARSGQANELNRQIIERLGLG